MTPMMSRCIRQSGRKSATRAIFVAVVSLPLLVPIASAQVFNQHDTAKPQDMPTATVSQEIKGVVKVNISMDKPRTFMAPRAMAVNASIADGHLMDPDLPVLLRGAGITTLRYPGGGFADNYHWSTNKPSNSQVPTAQRYSGFAQGTDFGHFVHLIDQVGTTVITVNYGSNQEGTGGGEPAEAAAWVAYANGSPTDTNVIGKDSTGLDWQNVGYWASLRASQPLAADDGKNFLRIAHPQPLNVKYWEVGNEVYKNGYYGGEGQELDLHAPYPKDAKDNDKQRRKNADLSPAAYAKAVLAYSKAMKAVDGRIKVGASVDSPVANAWDVQEWTPDPVTESTSKTPRSRKRRTRDWIGIATCYKQREKISTLLRSIGTPAIPQRPRTLKNLITRLSWQRRAKSSPISCRACWIFFASIAARTCRTSSCLSPTSVRNPILRLRMKR